MSIKSVIEEYSEIWENSYSVRSPSIESFSSIEDECTRLSQQLLSAMTPAVLSQLRRKFKKRRKAGTHVAQKVELVMSAAAAAEGIEFSSSGRRDAADQQWIDEDTFVRTIENIYGHHKFTTHAHNLFRLLDPYLTGLAAWSDLLDKLIEVGAKKTRSRAEVWRAVDEARGVKKLPHCKREPLVKLVPIVRAASYCCAAVTRGGRVGVYSGLRAALQTYEIWGHLRSVSTRIKNRWITDALYLEDIQCIVYCASDRTLTFYDASTLLHTLLYCITGLPTVPTCMSYLPPSLWIGDTRGDVTRLTPPPPFTAPGYFWPELLSPPHASHCNIQVFRRLHARSVRRIHRFDEVLVTCSLEAATSVRWRRVDMKINDYVCSFGRGVSCFDYAPSIQLLATGCPDGFIRLHTKASPAHAELGRQGSRPGIVDLKIVVNEEVVVGFDKDCTVSIWDVYEECLLQRIPIKFPFLNVLGGKAEFGPYSIHEGPPEKLQEDEDPDELHVTPGGTSCATSNVDEVVSAYKPSSELQITCGEYIYSLPLRPPRGPPPPPPPALARARTPRGWERGLEGVGLITPPAAPPPRATPPPHSPIRIELEPWSIEELDVDTLCQKAGLQGLLEKDFVQMMGLKQDLNKKLANLQADMAHISSRVSLGAPYLACSLHDPEPFDETPYKQ